MSFRSDFSSKLQFTQEKRQFAQNFTQIVFDMIKYSYKVSKRKEVREMKGKIFAVVEKVIKGAAVVSSESTSWLGLYQPKTPKTLIKSDKKK